MLTKICLYWHTLRYLKFSQLYERLKFKIHRQIPNTSSPPELNSRSGIWRVNISRPSSLVGPQEFIFLGEAGFLDDCGWDGPSKGKLWRYNQHYFDDLNASFAARRYKWHLSLLENWVKSNPPVTGVGWDSYPTSLRIVNWIKWASSGSDLPASCIKSLAIQARYLAKRIEWHLLGNHVLANAKALVFAGLFFKGDESDNWLGLGLSILEDELQEQILQDGGHFERSPMYHALILEDLLDLIAASQVWPGRIDTSVINDWKILAERMLFWLSKMMHPDGQITLFNDAAFNIAAAPRELFFYANFLGIEFDDSILNANPAVYLLNESGYIRLKHGSADAFLDVAPVGPDYLPGHAHADTLSFELSIMKQRIVVNGGTSTYAVGVDRTRERQTRSHSTVEIDGLSSSEVWDAFRVARRAYPFNLTVSSNESEVLVGCSHNGYARMKGKPIHHREWLMSKQNLTVSDWVIGGNYKSIARFILHPSIMVRADDSHNWYLCAPDGKRVLLRVITGRSFIESAAYAPEFGKVIETNCIAIEMQHGQSHAKFEWE